ARAIEYGTLPGSVAWAASFACLTMAFRDGALLPFPPGALERRTGTAPGVTTGSEEKRIWT
ncbi:MAG: hypothetical protein K8T20_01715, partial [Planctomycetes bacterium]|nr:hypothetical protein [Planctomycetota bacterium]